MSLETKAYNGQPVFVYYLADRLSPLKTGFWSAVGAVLGVSWGFYWTSYSGLPEYSWTGAYAGGITGAFLAGYFMTPSTVFIDAEQLLA